MYPAGSNLSFLSTKYLEGGEEKLYMQKTRLYGCVQFGVGPFAFVDPPC